MNRLQLATLLFWTGDDGIQGRKRLQKVVFLLQQAGCQLECQFTLHHFGPYSRDVADICDEMVAAGLIQEDGGPQTGVMQYKYQLKPQTREMLSQISEEQMTKFQKLGTSLTKENLWSLELGSTILYFYGQANNWTDALTKACDFKRVDSADKKSLEALELAKRIVSQVAI